MICLNNYLEFNGIFDAWHDGEEGDEIPGLRVGVVGEQRGVVAVEDIEDSEGEAVAERVRTVASRGEAEPVARDQSFSSAN